MRKYGSTNQVLQANSLCNKQTPQKVFHALLRASDSKVLYYIHLPTSFFLLHMYLAISSLKPSSELIAV